MNFMLTPTAGLPGLVTRWARLAVLALLGALLCACAAPKPYDYTAFKASRPASILVLPPVNDTPEVDAVAGVLSTTLRPLAEAGYYVLPVGLVAETFKQNGLTMPPDMHAVPPARLREIFGADAAIYLRVTQYGTSFMLLSSETRVTIEARLVDLRNGQPLWSGRATAASSESGANTGGGLAGLLAAAVITQIAGTVTDASFTYAAQANDRLLGVPRHHGLLFGPRSPRYQSD